jgi:hypothetical protein
MTSTCSRGGGVAVCVHKSLSSKKIDIQAINIEQVYVLVTLDAKSKYILGACYLPPSSNINSYLDHTNTIESLLSNADTNTNIILSGDYNLSGTKFYNNTFGLKYIGTRSQKSDIIFNSFSSLNLYQMNACVNDFGSTLDLIFTDVKNLTVSLSNQHLVKLDRYHPALQLDLEINYNNAHTCLPPYLDFKHTDYVEFNNYLYNIDWTFMYNLKNVNIALNYFYNIINEGIHLFVLKKQPGKYYFPCWFSNKLRNLIIKKNKIHKMYKLTNDHSYYETFSKIRYSCKFLSKQCYTNYLNNIQSNFINNPKDFWKFVKNKKQYNSLPNNMHLNGHYSDDLEIITDNFKSSFATAYSSSTPVNLLTTNITNNSDIYNFVDLSSCHLSLSDVFEGLSLLKPDTNFGPDLIPSIIFLNCKYALAKQIHFLFSLSLSSGIFPSSWKLSFISPIFKSGDRNDIQNYRPISKLNVLSKLFEKLLEPKITSSLIHTISNMQHGFCKSKSTITNLLIFYSDLVTTVQEKGQIDAVYTDLRKAFDSVNHSTLILKLKNLGVTDPMLSWFQSYLVGRKQQVKINNIISNSIEVTSGVPQGSHLSPILFNIFINDIHNIFTHSKFLLFADDLKLYSTINSIDDCKKLQMDLLNFEKWCLTNSLNINISKCSQITFTKRKNPITFNYSIMNNKLIIKSHIKDLGITLSNDLTFNEHITLICNKATRMFGFVKRNCREFNDPTCLKILYCSLIRSLVEYGSIIWNPYQTGHITKIEKIQKRFLIMMRYKLKKIDTPTKTLANELNLQSLENRRFNNDIIFLYKLLNNLIDCPELLAKIPFYIPKHTLRYTNTFYIQSQKQNYSHYAPLNRILLNGNTINNFDYFFDPPSKLNGILKKGL